MTREQQYWEDTQEALSRIFDRCEEIDPQSGYDMLEDIQFIRGFINKHKPRTEEQESILNKIRAEIAEYGSILVAYAITGHSDRDIENLIEGVLKKAKEQVLNIIDKYRTESEE